MTLVRNLTSGQGMNMGIVQQQPGQPITVMSAAPPAQTQAATILSQPVTSQAGGIDHSVSPVSCAACQHFWFSRPTATVVGKQTILILMF